MPHDGSDAATTAKRRLLHEFARRMNSDRWKIRSATVVERGRGVHIRERGSAGEILYARAPYPTA
jgi:hypothetical protein